VIPEKTSFKGDLLRNLPCNFQLTRGVCVCVCVCLFLYMALPGMSHDAGQPVLGDKLVQVIP
jgi:hypothetical protein